MNRRTLIAAALAGTMLTSPAIAQSTASDFTSYARYDKLGRVTGTISVDPDGVANATGKHLATRTTYDVRGNVTKVERGYLDAYQADSIAPQNWSGFKLAQQVVTTYDPANRKTSETVSGYDPIGQILVPVSLTNYSYDSVGRLKCTAVRMTVGAFSSAPADACVQTSGVAVPDRITRTVYDAAGQVRQVRKGVGTGLDQAEVTYTYTGNGKIETLIDANGNRAQYEYDGYDRMKRWRLPSQTGPTAYNDDTLTSALASAGSASSTDYEEYTYDANGNRKSLRKRDGSLLQYDYDNLNRMTLKTVPGRTGLDPTHTRDVHYAYDLRGLQTAARFDSMAGEGILTGYDGFGRLTTTTEALDGNSWSLDGYYDADGNRTGLLHRWDNTLFGYTYRHDGSFDVLKDPAANELVDFVYNDRGELAIGWRLGAAIDMDYSYDPAGRLESQGIRYPTVVNPVWDYTRNAAGQIATETLFVPPMAWTGFEAKDEVYTANGLNQYTQVGTSGFCHDDNGNLTADGERVYLYDIENRLVEMRVRVDLGACPTLTTGYTGARMAQLRYDPLGRLHEVKRYDDDLLTDLRRFLHDGDALVAEFNASGVMLSRHVHGPAMGADDPLVSYDNGASVALADARLLYSDPRGSIVFRSDTTGADNQINSYDEYGQPAVTNVGRFGYTGQVWLDELGMNYYKARIYSPRLGRFLQTDPIGYEDGFNMYAYVGNDPVNGVDPTGMVCGTRLKGAVGANCSGQSLAQASRAAKIENWNNDFKKLSGSEKQAVRDNAATQHGIFGIGREGIDSGTGVASAITLTLAASGSDKYPPLSNPYVHVVIPPGAVAHILNRHGAKSKGNGSKFHKRFSNQSGIIDLIQYAVTHFVPDQFAPPGMYRYAGSYRTFVGDLRNRGSSTFIYTVTGMMTGRNPQDGAAIVSISNAYPGLWIH